MATDRKSSNKGSCLQPSKFNTVTFSPFPTQFPKLNFHKLCKGWRTATFIFQKDKVVKYFRLGWNSSDVRSRKLAIPQFKLDVTEESVLLHPTASSFKLTNGDKFIVWPFLSLLFTDFRSLVSPSIILNSSYGSLHLILI